MTASLPGVFNVQQFTDTGAPASGHRLYTYSPGTTTQKVAYTDQAGTIPHTYTSDGLGGLYIALNARGELPAPLFITTGGYDLCLKTPAGATVWTRRTYAGSEGAIGGSSSAAEGAGMVGFLYSLGYAAGTVGKWLQDLATSAGSTFIGWVQSGSGTVTRTVSDKLRERVSVFDYGAKGDGITDDAAAFNAAGAAGVPIFIPYTAAGYKIGSTVTFSCDVLCEGTLNPTTAIGSSGTDYARFTVVIASAGYAVKRRVTGLRIAGSVALRAALVSGIRNDCENSLLIGCHVYQLNYGIVVRSYSQTYEKCNANQCNTNFDAYARASNLEVNALTILGGNYDSPVVRSAYLGDTSWSDAWGGGNLHGSVVYIGGGANFDGGEIKIDNCTGVKLDTGYSETSVSNYGVVLGGAADGSVRNVEITNWFFKSMRIAIKCLTAVNGMKVGRNFYVSVSHSALYAVSDLYHIEYTAGDATSSFTLGQEAHAGFRSLPVASVTFGNLTIPAQGLYRGRQTLLQDVGSWYPSGILQSGLTIKTNVASSACRYYTTPATGKAGTVSGSVFTFTTASDAAAFNGGDAIVTVPAGAVYVRSVDYEAGTMVIDGGVTAAGAATVSQQAAVFRSQTVSYSGAPPTSGSWVKGDIAENGIAAVGTAKRWQRVTTGSANVLGTDWVSEGPL